MFRDVHVANNKRLQAVALHGLVQLNKTLLEQRALDISRDNLHRKRQRINRNSQLAKLWIGSDKQLVLDGVLENGQIIKTEPDKNYQLGEAVAKHV